MPHVRSSILVPQAEWGPPYTGRATDTFVLSEDDSTLTQLSELKYTEDSNNDCRYQTVYTRHLG